MTETHAPIATEVDPIARAVLAAAPRIAESVRSGRATRIAVVGSGAEGMLDDLATEHPNVSLVVVDEPPDGRSESAGVRLVETGPFDLIVVRGPINSLGRPLDTLLMCRTALVDRGLAVTVSEQVAALDALAIAAGFTVVATRTGAPSLTVFRP